MVEDDSAAGTDGGGDERRGEASDDPSRRAGPGPTPEPIEPAAPDAFGAVQVWWGDGKGKTTAALGQAFRAAGHGYRVHVLQFMKGGADSVADVRGEYNAVAAIPGLTCEHAGHYGWHGRGDGSSEADHRAEARAGLERAREVLAASGDADLSTPFDLHAPAEDGVHMLVLDELGYAVNRDLLEPSAVDDLLDAKPADLELVATGGHEPPAPLVDRADVVSEVRERRHHFDDGVPARKGTEF